MNDYYDFYITSEEKLEYQDSNSGSDYFLSDMESNADNLRYQNYSSHTVYINFISEAKKTSFHITKLSNSSFFLNEAINEDQLIDDILNKEQAYIYNTLVLKLEKNINAETQFLLEDGIDVPKDSVKDFAKNVIYFLAFHSIYPNKLTTTAEGGICLIFNNLLERMYLELYNEGDMGFIIEDIANKKLKENKDLYSLDEIIQRLKRFYF